MPQRSPRPCQVPGCVNLTRDGRYCEQHSQEIQRDYDERRGSSAQRGYGYRWQRLRRMILREHPLCADPFGVHAEHGETVPASEVDHIIPKRDGGKDEVDNLQALCKSCHSVKTRREGGMGVAISGAAQG